MGGNISQLLPFATGVNANVVAPAAYALEPYLQQGFQNGVLEPYDLNTVLRQAMFSSAMIGKFTADFGPNAVNDDANLQNYENNFVAALHELFVGIPDVLDVGVANAIAINPQPAETSYAVPMEFIIKVFATNILTAGTGATTISVSGQAPIPLILPNGGQLLPGDIIQNSKILVSYEAVSNSFQLLSPRGTAATTQQIIHYGRDVSLTANQIVAPVDGSVVSYIQPEWFAIVVNNTNTSTVVTANINNLGAIPITRGNGGALQVGDLVSGTIALMCFDGTQLQLNNPQQWGNGTSGAPANWNTIVGPLWPYWLSVKSAVVSVPPSSPSNGDVYLIPATGATGAWAGSGNQLVQWYSTTTSWVFRVYPSSSLIGTADTNQYFQNISGSWSEVWLPSPGRLFFFSQL